MLGLAAIQADNQRLKEKLERLEKLESNNLAQVLAQAVTYGNQNQSGAQQRSKFMGKPREPKLTPGTDGSLNPNIKCRYCKDTGHITKVCPRIKARDEYNAAKAAAKSAKSEKLTALGQKDPGQGQTSTGKAKLSGKRQYSDNDWEQLVEHVRCNTITRASKLEIMEQAVAPCPEVTLKTKGSTFKALLDFGSMVTLI